MDQLFIRKKVNKMAFNWLITVMSITLDAGPPMLLGGDQRCLGHWEGPPRRTEVAIPEEELKLCGTPELAHTEAGSERSMPPKASSHH